MPKDNVVDFTTFKKSHEPRERTAAGSHFHQPKAPPEYCVNHDTYLVACLTNEGIHTIVAKCPNEEEVGFADITHSIESEMEERGETVLAMSVKRVTELEEE